MDNLKAEDINASYKILQTAIRRHHDASAKYETAKRDYEVKEMRAIHSNQVEGSNAQKRKAHLEHILFAEGENLHLCKMEESAERTWLEIGKADVEWAKTRLRLMELEVNISQVGVNNG